MMACYLLLLFSRGWVAKELKKQKERKRNQKRLIFCFWPDSSNISCTFFVETCLNLCRHVACRENSTFFVSCEEMYLHMEYQGGNSDSMHVLSAVNKYIWICHSRKRFKFLSGCITYYIYIKEPVKTTPNCASNRI